ncbi:hypothetical protein PU560_04610 [Georgenia sp. 10Sc9-8]|uniref:Uncharacterized protein n=1 Tax=Georgenia halotolerans TaxID=3028317 RepID=A0ABT5TWT9_9MICO|nr:hypothetical protein [Georgenia halotolerans]
MPSYRVRAAIGALRAGVDAPEVLPAAAAAARARATVEADDVGLVAGVPYVTVRFTAADDGEALAVAAAVLAALLSCAEVGSTTVDRRAGARWRTVR